MATPHIICTVTNDLTYDQRMQRICGSLCQAGYKVTLVGRLRPNSLPLDEQPFRQVRLKIRHQSGKRFYWQYNLALYRWLKKEARQLAGFPLAICAIDLDTIVPCYLISRQFGLPRVYDAHELFTELTEVKRRPWISAIWKWIERNYVPKFKAGYTVNQFIAEEFERRYGVEYTVIRNLPVRKHCDTNDMTDKLPPLPERFFLYQGAVNEGRAFDALITAMKQVEIPLVIAGDGNYASRVRQLIEQHDLKRKVLMIGHVQPGILKCITPKAFAGLTLFDNTGLNQYYSLANRFFDYVQAGIPQICVDYPEYRALNNDHKVALLLANPSTANIAHAMNKLLGDNVLYQQLKRETGPAAEQWNWENEAGHLIAYWQEILPVY